jgi:hypothetical protein
MSIILYVPAEMVLVPTQVQTVLGLHMEREPVETAKVTDREAVLDALRRGWERGVARVPHPAAFPPTSKSPTMKAVHAKSWADFVRNARMWTVENVPEGGFRIQGWVSPPRKSHFEPNNQELIEFPESVSIRDVLERLISEMQMAARENH